MTDALLPCSGLLVAACSVLALAGCSGGGGGATRTPSGPPSQCPVSASSGLTAVRSWTVQVSHDGYTGHVEPDMALNPRHPGHILAASQAERGARVRVPVAYSSVDGGRHWARTSPLPLPAGYALGADTTVGFTADGTGFVSATVVGAEGAGFASRVRRGEVVLWRTLNSGRSFDPPTVVFKGTTLEDHPWLSISSDATLSIAWTDQAGLRFAQSSDEGRHFGLARVLVPGPAPLDPVVVTTANDLFVFYETEASNSIGLHVLRSFDRGARFVEPVLIGTAVEDHLPGRGAGSKATGELPLFGAVAASDGRAYVAIAEVNQAVGAPRILIWSSTTHADRWSAPQPLNDAFTSGLAQTQPRLAVTSDGSLEVLYLATARTGTIHVVATDIHGTRVSKGQNLNTFCVPEGTFIGDYQALLNPTIPNLAMWNGRQPGARNAGLQILVTRIP